MTLDWLRLLLWLGSGFTVLISLPLMPFRTQALPSDMPNGSDLSGADLSGANLPGADLPEADPPGIDDDDSSPSQADVLAQALEAEELDLDPAILEGSPVLQRWLDNDPDLLQTIRHDPAFRTRLRGGYTQVDDEGGIQVGVEDIFLGDTGLTLNGDYYQVNGGDRHSWGVALRYYTLPLGSRVNIAPVVGYRAITLSDDDDDDEIDGAEIGLRVLLVPSRTGAADLAVIQSWVSPGNDRQETSLTTVTAGYALTQDLRLSSDIQIQVRGDRQDTRFGLGLEWML